MLLSILPKSYKNYARAMGKKDGTLSIFGGRSTLACSKLGRSSCGGFDLDQVIIAEYPSRDAYLSMSCSEGQIEISFIISGSCHGLKYTFSFSFKEYMENAHFRHLGLERLYILYIHDIYPAVTLFTSLPFSSYQF